MRCPWASMSPGSIARPLVSTIAASAGILISDAGPAGDDLVALDHDRRVVNRRHLVARDQHAADEREVLRRLRARRSGGGQQCDNARDRDPAIGKHCHKAPQQAANTGTDSGSGGAHYKCRVIIPL